MTSIEGTRIGVFVSGGLSSWAICQYLKDRGAEVVALWGDVDQYDEPCLEDFFEDLTATGIEVVRTDLRPQIARVGLKMLSYGALADEPHPNTSSALRYVLCRGLVAELRRRHCRRFSHGGNHARAFAGYARHFMPDIDHFDPWSDPDFTSRLGRREQLAAYLHNPRNATMIRAKVYRSTDSSMLGTRYRDDGGEDPASDFVPPSPLMSLVPWAADNGRLAVTIGYRQGVATGLDGQRVDAADVLERANQLAGRHGISVKTVFHDRCRAVYESPGLDLLWRGLQALKQLSLSGDERRRYRELSRQIGRAIRSGEYHTAQCRRWRRQMGPLCARLSGTVGVRLYRGSVQCVSIEGVAGASVVAFKPRGFAAGTTPWPLPPDYAQQALAS